MLRSYWRLLALGALLGVLALVGGVGFVSYKEQDNRFCISCHTQPETEYFDRNVRADATQSAEDLASFHHRTKDIRCIDCHVGEGFVGRATVVSLAAWDAFKHYTGLARQPAVIVFPVQNEACIKCHEQDIQKPGFDNHEHNKYFDPQLSPPFIRCTNCHVSHRAGDERTAFQFRDAILPRCEYCHQQTGRGPRGQATPLP
jgi:nitrate/TMAO reductase-like tetraheme cytochrome c subunit